MKHEKFGREVRGDDNHIISPLLLLPSLGDFPLPQTLLEYPVKSYFCFRYRQLSTFRPWVTHSYGGGGILFLL